MRSVPAHRHSALRGPGSYGQDKEVFHALAVGIPATLASELSGHSNLRLADHFDRAVTTFPD